MLEKMKKIVRDGDTCVLATVSGGKPHCSLMAYVSSEDCSEIYMVTSRETTKFRNLNPTSCLFTISDLKYDHFSVVAHVISIGYSNKLQM